MNVLPKPQALWAGAVGKAGTLTIPEAEAAATLVVADLHALYPHSFADKLPVLLASHAPRHLILAGDTLDLRFYRQHPDLIRPEDGVALLDTLRGLLKQGVRVTVIPGNHDPHWRKLLAGTAPAGMLPSALEEAMAALRPFHLTGQLAVHDEVRIGATAIVHGHRGWQGDWLHYAAVPFDLINDRKGIRVPSEGFLHARGLAVIFSGFYERMALWARREGLERIIHGHVHYPISSLNRGVRLDCLPPWLEGQGNGGGYWLGDPHEGWTKLGRYKDSAGHKDK